MKTEPKEMQALRIHEFGGPEVLCIEQIAIPEIRPDEMLVKVRGAAINPFDYKVRNGLFKEMRPLRFPAILGSDISGTVVSVGALVSRFKEGDSVIAKVENGFAEYVACKSDVAAMAPKSMPLVDAAGIPVVSTTAWMALFDTAQLRKEQSILIHGGSGGVGSFGIQLAKLAGAKVYTTASKDNIALVKSLGADHVIDYQHQDFTKEIEAVDVVFDTIGGPTQEKSFSILKKNGVLVSIIHPPSTALAQQHSVRAVFQSSTSNGARLEEIVQKIDAGHLRLLVDQKFSFEQAKDAFNLIESGNAHGKVILSIE